MSDEPESENRFPAGGARISMIVRPCCAGLADSVIMPLIKLQPLHAGAQLVRGTSKRRRNFTVVRKQRLSARRKRLFARSADRHAMGPRMGTA